MYLRPRLGQSDSSSCASCVPRADAELAPVFPPPAHDPQRLDWLAGHVGLELRNVVANYPFESSRGFPGSEPNSGHRDHSRLSCGAGGTQLGPGASIPRAVLAHTLVIDLHRRDGANWRAISADPKMIRRQPSRAIGEPARPAKHRICHHLTVTNALWKRASWRSAWSPASVRGVDSWSSTV
jgi:hypothetical protein